MVQSTVQPARVSPLLRRCVYAFAFVSLVAAGACDEGVLLPEPEEMTPASVVSAETLG